MASISKDPSGNVSIQVVCGDKRRRTIRLGKVSQKVAEAVKLKVEHLHNASVMKSPLDPDTARWVGGIGDELAARLAAAGLIPTRQSAKLGAFLGEYITRRGADSKGGTVTNLNTVRNDVVNFFGADTDLREITEKRADDFRTHYLTRTPKLAAATVARRLKTVRLFFKHALRVKLIPANPFADVTAAGGLPAERQYYITPEDTAKLLAAASPTWRIVIALTRFAGLRNPSEVLSLKWEHVNFETGRMTVPSPKTEHHSGKAYRTVPLFPELRPYLDEVFELAEEGAVYVVGGGDRGRVPGRGRSSGRVDECEHADHVPEDRPPGRTTAVAAVVPQPAGELRDRPDEKSPDPLRVQLAREHAYCRPAALPASSGSGLRAGRRWRCKKRCSGGAKAGAVRSGQERPGNDRGDENPSEEELSSPGVRCCHFRPIIQVGDTGFEPVTSSV
jgi:site-specific recombinase XerC